MNKIKINQIETNGKLYEGYLWLSDSNKPKVYDNQEIDLVLKDNVNPFIVEGQLYNREEHVSYSIKYIDGEYLVYQYKEVFDDTTDANIEHKSYLPNRMEEIGNRMLHFLRYWEPQVDSCCEGMEALVITKNVFVGFMNVEKKKEN